MAFDIKAATPDTSLPVGGFLIGADSQSASDPSIYSIDAAHSALFNYALLSANESAFAATGYSLTGSDATSGFSLTGTWNTTGTPTAIKLDITDTASDAASLLMDLQVGGASQFSVRKNGNIGVGSAASVSYGIYAPSRTFYSNGYALTSIGYVYWSDLYLNRKAAATLQLGAADAAAPVAQSLGVQSVVAGTTNTAGANFNINGSMGTGSGVGGSIIFNVSTAGGSGTAQNALAAALTIDSTKKAAFGGSLELAPTQNTDTVTFGGTSLGLYFMTDEDGSLLARRWNSSIFGLCMGTRGGGLVGFVLGQYTPLGFSSASQPDGDSTVDVWLYRDAANTLALRNGTNAQASRVYGTYTDASNYRRVEIAMTTGGVASITPSGAGTGSSGNVIHISGLPTSNPGPGILWNNAGTPAIGT